MVAALRHKGCLPFSMYIVLRSTVNTSSASKSASTATEFGKIARATQSTLTYLSPL